MSNNWKLGDKVLCVKSDPQRTTVAGYEYVVDGFSCCPKCGAPLIFLQGFDQIKYSIHSVCGFEGIRMRIAFYKSRFIKPDLASLEQHRAEVSAKELLEIKTLQQQ